MASVGEFELIERYFTRPVKRAWLGVGDDCAFINPTPGMSTVVSTDMLLEGRHFLPDISAERLGHKALAVNLSDLAACGAKPVAFTLALALPEADPEWLAGFSKGLFAIADRFDCELIGGDTTRGPRAICITVLGEQAPGQALLRSGAHAGDDIFVSGVLGDARLALEAIRGHASLDAATLSKVRKTMEVPTPRIALGIALRGLATSAIDLSDGLSGDLGHVLDRSGVSALVSLDAMPRSATLAAQPPEVQRRCLVSGGDDYELLFTAPPELRAFIADASTQAGVTVTRIGRIEAGKGLRFLDRAGEPLNFDEPSFDHFRD
ncbi:MAG: thiamine-phosphate kinase [Pseudomonadota bacterium]|nr:thiamine-phosphate kinase [Pseudomonadota bacterium]